MTSARAAALRDAAQAERQPDIVERRSPTASASAPGRRSRSRVCGRRRAGLAPRPVDRAGGRLAEAGDDAERRRLAAAGRAEQADELALRRCRATCSAARPCRWRRSSRRCEARPAASAARVAARSAGRSAAVFNRWLRLSPGSRRRRYRVTCIQRRPAEHDSAGRPSLSARRHCGGCAYFFSSMPTFLQTNLVGVDLRDSRVGLDDLGLDHLVEEVLHLGVGQAADAAFVGGARNRPGRTPSSWPIEKAIWSSVISGLSFLIRSLAALLSP